jgi:hypothetical protein
MKQRSLRNPCLLYDLIYAGPFEAPPVKQIQRSFQDLGSCAFCLSGFRHLCIMKPTSWYVVKHFFAWTTLCPSYRLKRYSIRAAQFLGVFLLRLLECKVSEGGNSDWPLRAKPSRSLS